MEKKLLENDWGQLLKDEFTQDYYVKLREFLKSEYANYQVYPQNCDIFNALHLTPFKGVRVVILGQDPYHGPNQAHGLSFSVQPGVAIPPSLKNIFQELQSDIGCQIPNHGHLVNWAKQGVLLLNTVLTVREGQAHSHKGKGWETFTNRVITLLNTKDTPVVYILWGNAAQNKEAIIDSSKHYIVKASHPSPLSAHLGFFGSQPFSKTNQILKQNGLSVIDWEIPPI